MNTGHHHSAQILDPDDEADARVLAQLRADPRLEFVDQRSPHADGQPTRWVHYPWRRVVVGLVGPQAFRTLRLDRNRNLITAAEQDRLAKLRIGVVGLSVGHAIAHALATQGVCGELRLADFDALELSNLNRVPATVFDVGVNKAVVTARRIAELDPYLPVRVWESGLTPDTMEPFLDGLDVVVEECDSLEMKMLVREAARTHRIPVLMATSDRGLIDVERFDDEPQRPILHGLLRDVDVARLSELTTHEKVPYVLRVLDAASLSPRGAASLVEVGHTLSTWPQLAGDVAVGASAVCEAVRRIGLHEPLRSGRIRIDVADILDHLEEPEVPELAELSRLPQAALTDNANQLDEGGGIAGLVASAATRAPSGGNSQPWHVQVQSDAITLRLAPEHTSTMDVGFRASAVAIGAAVFNARVAAAAHGVLGPTEINEPDGGCPLVATVHLAADTDPQLARLFPAVLHRETSRHRGAPKPVTADTAAELAHVAQQEGARLALLSDRDDTEQAADILGAADRLRYLTPQLHAEMISELRWPGRDPMQTGIDVRSLELNTGEFARLEILRRPDVMARLADWDAGQPLGADTRSRVAASAAVAVISVRGTALTDYARGGSAAEAVWTIAQQRGFAVQPISPLFLYAHTDEERKELSPDFAQELHRLQRRFVDLTETGRDESHVLVLRLCDAPPASVRSRRRGIGDTG